MLDAYDSAYYVHGGNGEPLQQEREAQHPPQDRVYNAHPAHIGDACQEKEEYRDDYEGEGLGSEHCLSLNRHGHRV